MSDIDRHNDALAGVLQPAVHDAATGVGAIDVDHGTKTMSRVSSEVSPPAANQQCQRHNQRKKHRCNKTTNGSFLIPMIIFVCVNGHTASPIRQERCSLPQKYSSFVNFTNCYVPNVTEIASRVPNAMELYFAGNYITEIDVDAFKQNYRLQRLTITRNHYFIMPRDYCFINSTTIDSLDISENGNIPCLFPIVFECLPRLKTVRMFMNENCPCTRKLMQETEKTINILCDSPDKINRSSKHNEVSEETSRSILTPSPGPGLESLTTKSSDLHISQQRCHFPSKRGSRVKLTNCFVPNVTDVASRVPNATELYFSENNITKVDIDSFKQNYRLRSLTITRNHNLTLSSVSCFIHSTTIESLDISENSNIPCLSPSVFKCLPHLRKVRMLMNENCECTRKLMQEANKTIIIECDSSYKINKRNKHTKVPEETSSSMSTPPRDPVIEDSTIESSDYPDPGISNSTTPTTTVIAFSLLGGLLVLVIIIGNYIS